MSTPKGIFFLAMLVLGCSSPSRPLAVPDPKAPVPAIVTRLPLPAPRAEGRAEPLAPCEVLRDHFSDLVSSDYIATNRLSFASDDERSDFQAQWRDEMVAAGSFTRFDEACAALYSPEFFDCEMAARSLTGTGKCVEKARSEKSRVAR